MGSLPIPVPVQPVLADVLRDAVGHEVADRLARPDPSADQRRGDRQPGDLDEADAADGDAGVSELVADARAPDEVRKGEQLPGVAPGEDLGEAASPAASPKVAATGALCADRRTPSFGTARSSRSPKVSARASPARIFDQDQRTCSAVSALTVSPPPVGIPARRPTQRPARRPARRSAHRQLENQPEGRGDQPKSQPEHQPADQPTNQPGRKACASLLGWCGVLS